MGKVARSLGEHTWVASGPAHSWFRTHLRLEPDLLGVLNLLLVDDDLQRLSQSLFFLVDLPTPSVKAWSEDQLRSSTLSVGWSQLNLTPHACASLPLETAACGMVFRSAHLHMLKVLRDQRLVT